MTQIPWYHWLDSHLGEHEIEGRDFNNPFILSLFKNTSYHPLNDETPWCAAAINTALIETGYKGTGSAAAISFANYGMPCNKIRGAIIVFKWADGGHHVALLNRVIDDKYVECLGGNQADTVKLSKYKISSIIACRWPIKAEK